MAILSISSHAYTVLNCAALSPAELQTQFNTLGAQGWQLVTVHKDTIYTFMRASGTFTLTV